MQADMTDAPNESPNGSQFESQADLQDAQTEGTQKAQNIAPDLQKQIQNLESQVKEKESKYVYLYAEFENFKRRAVKERSDLMKYGWESIAKDLLQNVDDLERALGHVSSTTDRSLSEGLTMVLNQFKSTLQKQGVLPIECLNKEFDPNFHEAVGQEPSDLPSGTITREHSRGYTLHGRLLRASRVVLSTGKPN